jgi:hypothetical protein
LGVASIGLLHLLTRPRAPRTCRRDIQETSKDASSKRANASPASTSRQEDAAKGWRSDMGIEPTQDGSTAPQTVLKTAPVTRPEAAPLAMTLREARTDVNAAKTALPTILQAPPPAALRPLLRRV